MRKLVLALVAVSVLIVGGSVGPPAYAQTSVSPCVRVSGGCVPVSAANPFPITGTISATTSATASATLPTLTGGTGRALYESLSAGLFVNPIFGTTIVDSSHGLPVNVIAGGLGGSTFGSAFPATGVAIGMSDGTNLQQFVSALALGDGVNGNNTAAVAPWWWNGTTYDRTSPIGLKGDAACSTDNGTCSLIALQKRGNQNISSSVPAGTNLIGKVGIDQTTPGTTNGVQVNAALPAGTNVIGDIRNITGTFTTIPTFKFDQTTPGTTNNVAVGTITGTKAAGTAAASAALTGCVYNSTDVAPTDGQQVGTQCDLNGYVVTKPYAKSADLVSGVTAAMTGTTSTSLIGAPSGSLHNYITQLICTNSHATVGTFVLIQDGSGGTTIYEGYAAAVGGGFSLTFPAPLRQPTAATALYVADVTTGANVICAGSGFRAL